MKDEHLNKCKECVKKRVSKRETKIRSTPEGLEFERKRNREKYHRLGYKEKQLEWDKHKPWKQTSKYKNLNRDLKRRNLLGKNEVSHHWNYSDEHLRDIFIMPLFVHKKIHKKLIFNLESKIFSDGKNLLSTKDKHFKFIKTLLTTEEVLQIKQCKPF